MVDRSSEPDCILEEAHFPEMGCCSEMERCPEVGCCPEVERCLEVKYNPETGCCPGFDNSDSADPDSDNSDSDSFGVPFSIPHLIITCTSKSFHILSQVIIVIQ